ncbi:MAG: gamma-glutamyl-gamma-aminobutyrate hydrolase family protein [Acidobacteria bacterium]|nr:gamma-glutamyl-gamma-aminobutyrate hydrolase family protein [Acidobacteriota bacterium]
MGSGSQRKPLIGLTCRWDEEHDWYYLSSDYTKAIAAAGGVPVQIPLIPDMASELAERLDAFVLCGSPSDIDPARYGQSRHPEVQIVHPDRDETDHRTLQQAFQNCKPVLGICFGMQSLNVFLGGTLVQHIPEAVPNALAHKDRQIRHPIQLEPGAEITQWAGSTPEVSVNSTHHQCIAKPGRGLRVVARAPDGVIEAVEGEFTGHFVLGVQWHPERIWQTEPLSAQILVELVRAAQQWRDNHRRAAESALHWETGKPL